VEFSFLDNTIDPRILKEALEFLGNVVASDSSNAAFLVNMNYFKILTQSYQILIGRKADPTLNHLYSIRID